MAHMANVGKREKGTETEKWEKLARMTHGKHVAVDMVKQQAG